MASLAVTPAPGPDYPDPGAEGEPSGSSLGQLSFGGVDALFDAADLSFRGAGLDLCGEVVDLVAEGFGLRVRHALLIRVPDTRRKCHLRSELR